MFGLRKLLVAAAALLALGQSANAFELGIIGFQTDERLVNSSYDDATRSITSNNKWRGVGDAGTSGTWLFRNGQFSLVQFDVDASFDGQNNPETVLDYNTPP